MEYYENRLKTFDSWPFDEKELVQKLAVMGQYSTDSATLSTCCCYCSYNLEEWSKEDHPLTEHFKRNPNCPIFGLYRAPTRKWFSSVGELKLQNKDEVDSYSERKFIQLKISPEFSFYLCMLCGSSDFNHKCSHPSGPGILRKKKIFSKELERDFFFIKYFKGEFNHQLSQILERKEKLNDCIEKLSVISHILSFNPKHSEFDTLRSFLESGARVIYKSIESKLMEIETKAVDSICDDSVTIK